MLKKAAEIAKGAQKVGHEDKVGRVSMDQIREIVRTKMEDLNAFDEEAGCRQIVGTAKSMGIEVY